jgi:membrane protein
MGGVGRVVKRTLVSFYDDQATHHAAALTYYSLMSLFPAALLGLSLLGLLGQYPETYNAVINYLEDVAPASVVDPLDRSLRTALQSKGTATTTLIISIVIAFYGTTGVLEAARRALNVVFEAKNGRSFLRRKAIDIVSSVILMALVLVSLVMVFVGGRFAKDMFGYIGLGDTAAQVWNIVRWPGAFLAATLAFSYVYYVTPDVEHRAYHWLTPGAVVGVLTWLLVSVGLSTYLSSIGDIGALYGTFAAAIVLVGWLWLTNVALLFGAELNAEIEREKQISEGVPPAQTLDLPDLGAS